VKPVPTTIVVVLALLVSSIVGTFVVALVLRAASRSADAGVRPGSAAANDGTPPADAAVSDGPEGPRARAVLRGGRWIGLLERLAVTGCIVAGFPSGVAVIVAIKGLGRYPELRENPGASERFVVGTLASLVWAALLGWVALRIIHA
jgi:F0F1-type ATP synthase membrane subunit c/vacuolar-type H+-ATPase subunit K